nr:S-layer homology domain-containing protein [Phormidium sp. CCY1219]
MSNRFAFIPVVLLVLVSLSACANRPNSEQLEQTFAPDPSLQENPVTLGESTVAPVTGDAGADSPAKLPQDFPEAIARYPNATLVEVIPPTRADAAAEATNKPEGVSTVWQTSDSTEALFDFYTTQFQQSNWEIVPQPEAAQPDKLTARKGDELVVTLTLDPNPALSPAAETANQGPQTTQFILQYREGDRATTELPVEPSTDTEEIAATEPTDTEATPPNSTDAQTPTGLESVPEQLRPYLADLEQLGVLRLDSQSTKTNSDNTQKPLELNQPIRRAQFAQWLIETNNQIYANQTAKQIRRAPRSTKPAFTDVGQSNPAFGAIQGLAEAGIIPSPLSGDSAAVSFRPDAPLTREDLLLWKVPLDIRGNLPTASVDAVQETWGFQDAAKIDPKALPAVLADYQNGDLSNIRRAFGYTRLFQPKKAVTRAESAAAIWYFGVQGDGLSAEDALQIQPQTTP